MFMHTTPQKESRLCFVAVVERNVIFCELHISPSFIGGVYLQNTQACASSLAHDRREKSGVVREREDQFPVL